MSDQLREQLARWLFERDYDERSLSSPQEGAWEEWVEFNREQWRQEADAVIAEVDRLRAEK